MIFLAIFFALLIEQVRPLGAHSAPHQLARLWVAQVLRSCDAGSMGAARLAWALAVLLPAALALIPVSESVSAALLHHEGILGELLMLAMASLFRIALMLRMSRTNIAIPSISRL